MNKKPDTCIAELEAKRKSLRATALIIIAVYVVALVVSFFNIIIAALIALLNIVFYVFMFRSGKKKYLAMYYEANTVFGLGKIFDAVEYDAKGRIDYAEVESSHLLPVDGKEKNFACKNYVRGTWKGIKCEISEVSTPYRYVDANLKDKYAFLGGTWIKASLSEPGGRDFKVVNRHFLHTFSYSQYKKAGYKELWIEDKAISDIYLVFVPSGAPEDVMPMSEDCLRKLKALTEKINYALSFSVSGSDVNVFLHRRFYTDKIPVKYRMDEEKVRFNRLPELEQVLKLVKSCGK